MEYHELLKKVSEIQSKEDVQFLAEMALQNTDICTSIWKIASHEEDKVAWYAVWILEHISKQKPELLLPFQHKLYDVIPQQTHIGIRRGLFNLVTRMPIHKKEAGKLIEPAIAWLMNSKESTAIRAQSVRFLSEVYLLEPDFKNELQSILEEAYQNNASTGLRNVITRALNVINGSRKRL